LCRASIFLVCLAFLVGFLWCGHGVSFTLVLGIAIGRGIHGRSFAIIVVFAAIWVGIVVRLVSNEKIRKLYPPLIWCDPLVGVIVRVRTPGVRAIVAARVAITKDKFSHTREKWR